MAGDGGIGNVWQAQLAEEAALFFLGRLAAFGERQKAFERQLQRFFAQNFGFERFADQGRARAQDGDLDAFQMRIVEQLLLGRGTLPPQTAALADGELGVELGFDEPGQREIEIVAAQQQMLADGSAREVHQIALAGDANQAEIAGAAADVADQHNLAIEQLLTRLREVVGDPRVERRGGLFEQREALDAGFFRRHDRELAGLFVERSWDGEHDVLFGEGSGLGAVPLFAELGDISRRDFHGREHATGLGRIPRQDLGGAVDVGIGEPRFGRMHQAGGDERALIAGIGADGLTVFEKEKRWQSAARLDAAGGHQLRGIKDVDGREIEIFGFAGVDIGEGGVGGAEIDADFHKCLK